MEVTKQNSINECGVCVINSFVKHYYKHSNKEKILNAANLSSNGLSIYDFENLGQKFGLYVESYECEWAEFCSLKNNQYYGLLINKNELMHYVIVFKKKDSLILFDSDLGKNEFKYQEFRKNYANIVFNISKMKSSISYTSPKINLQTIDLKFLLICIFLHFCIIGLSTLFANVFNWTLNFSVYSKSINNLINLVFIFFLITLLNGLINFILKHYSLIRFKQNFKYLVFKLINSLSSKDYSFNNKIDQSYLYLIDSSIVSICNFLTVDIPVLITDCLMLLISVIIFSIIKPIFLVFCLINITINLLFGLITYNFKSNNLEKVIKNSNFNNNVSKETIEQINTEENFEILNHNINKMKNNFFQFEKIYSNKAFFDNRVSFYETFLNNVLYLLMIATGGYLLINDGLNIGLLTFLVSLLGMFGSATNNICNFPYKTKEYERMSNVYWSFTNISNLIKDSFIKNVNEIKTLCFKSDSNFQIIKNNDVIKSDKLISLKNFHSINNYSNQNKFFFKQKFIKINPDSKVPIDYIKQNISKNQGLASDLLRKFGINLNKAYFSLHEQQIINFIFACFQNDKIICFNNCFKYLTKQEKSFVKQKINDLINENNFIFFINN